MRRDQAVERAVWLVMRGDVTAVSSFNAAMEGCRRFGRYSQTLLLWEHMCRAEVPPDRLLVFNVKEGWAPLCEFLGKEEPAVPFPFVNESADLERATAVMKVLSWGWLPAAAAPGVARGCCCRCWRAG